jgi:hypothetical protein
MSGRVASGNTLAVIIRLGQSSKEKLWIIGMF